MDQAITYVTTELSGFQSIHSIIALAVCFNNCETSYGKQSFIVEQLWMLRESKNNL